MVKIKIDKLKQDDKNFNLHTDEGMKLLENSVESVGILEAITVSEDDVIISGNARHTVISDKYKNIDPIVVETDGTQPVIIKRTDIKSNTAEFYKSALLANTTAKKNINIDGKKVRQVAVEYGFEVVELGLDEVKLPYNYKEDAEAAEENLIYPITILQNEEDAAMFYQIKDLLSKNDLKTFSEILKFYYKQKIVNNESE